MTVCSYTVVVSHVSLLTFEEKSQLKILQTILAHKRSVEAYHSGAFYQSFIICGQLHPWSRIEILAHSLKGFRSYGYLTLGCARHTKFSALLAAKLCVGCKYVFEVQEWYRPLLSPYHHAKFGRAGHGFCTPPGGETFDVFTGSIARRYFGYARGDFEVSRIGLEVWVQKPQKFPTSVIFAWLCVIIYSSIY